MKPIELPTLAPAAEPALAPDQIARMQEFGRAIRSAWGSRTRCARLPRSATP